MRAKLALVPLMFTLVAGCTVAADGQDERASGSTTDPLCARDADCTPTLEPGGSGTTVKVSHAPVAEIEINTCLKGLGTIEEDLKATVSKAITAVVPGTWLDTVCVGNVERVGVWLAAPTTTDTAAQRETALSGLSLLKGTEGFAVNFGAAFIAKAVATRWAGQAKTLDGAGLVENMAIVLDKVHLQSLGYSLVAPNMVTANLSGYFVASVLGGPWSDFPFTASSIDVLSIDPIDHHLLCTSPGSPLAIDGLPDTTLDQPLVHVGCPFVEALPESIPLPFKLKRVFDWQRVTVTSGGISMGALTRDVARVPTVAIKGPKTFVLEEPGPVKGVYAFDTTDMRPPLTAHWSGPTSATIASPDALATSISFNPPTTTALSTPRTISVTVTDTDGLTKSASYVVNLKKDPCPNPHNPSCL